MFGFGLFELLIIAAIILFFIKGGKVLPQLGAGIGKSITNFKKEMRDSPTDKNADTKKIPKDE
jgi:sec-independent protein translocase protein TatA